MKTAISVLWEFLSYLGIDMGQLALADFDRVVWITRTTLLVIIAIVTVEVVIVVILILNRIVGRRNN